MTLASKPVLVLNKSWVPIRIASLKDALCKLTCENEEGAPKAKIIDPQDYAVYSWDDWSKLNAKNEETIRGVNHNVRLPKVIIVDYDKSPHERVKYSRRHVYRRDNYTCQYCGHNLSTEFLNIDHVIPKAQGGKTTWANTVLSCIDCNTKKGNRTPEQAGMKLIKQPKKPKFNLFKTERRFIDPDWQKFVSEMYWSIPLENDEVD